MSFCYHKLFSFPWKHLNRVFRSKWLKERRSLWPFQFSLSGFLIEERSRSVFSSTKTTIAATATPPPPPTLATKHQQLQKQQIQQTTASIKTRKITTATPQPTPEAATKTTSTTITTETTTTTTTSIATTTTTLSTIDNNEEPNSYHSHFCNSSIHQLRSTVYKDPSREIGWSGFRNLSRRTLRRFRSRFRRIRSSPSSPLSVALLRRLQW